MRKEDLAEKLFRDGYNCAQAVVGAFCEELNLPIETVTKMISGFGGGIGRMRETCGAVSGMVFVLSTLEGYSSPTADVEKRDLYAKTKALVSKFAEENGSIICRELLGIKKGEKYNPVPEKRTDNYYKSRSCVDSVRSATKILADYLGK